MAYEVLSSEVAEATIYTDVIFTMEDGTEMQIKVAHFRPKSVDEMIQTIEDREKQEQTQLDDIQRNTELKDEFDKKMVEMSMMRADPMTPVEKIKG